MDCRTFQRNLEDYLDGGFDFPGRFGMERHAQQCIGCGKTMADAQRLSRLIGEVKRVKAPADFESSVLKEIGNRKLNSRFFRLRQFWIYGFERPSWRKLALASSSVAVLLLGAFYAYNQSFRLLSAQPPPDRIPAIQDSTSAQDAENPVNTDDKYPETKRAAVSGHPQAEEKQKAFKSMRPRTAAAPKEEFFADRQQDENYVEYLLMGPDNRPVTVRVPLPKEIQMQYGQPSEEYFIRNVSH